MYIIRTIPLTKVGHLNELTYFSKISYPVGALCVIPVRNNNISAMVIDSEPVPRAKTMLRGMDFSLKKLPEQSNTRALTKETIATAHALADYYAVPLADILVALLPADVRDGARTLPYTPHQTLTSIDTYDSHTVSEPDIRVLQAPLRERVRIYRTLVREAFARGGSVVIVAPTSTETRALGTMLSGGIEDRTIVIHTHLSSRQSRDVYEHLQEFATPKLIITYPGYALIERHDVMTVIVDHERSPHFITRTHPHLDWRIALRIHAERTGRTLIYGDLLPTTETEYHRRTERYTTIDEAPKRIPLPGTLKIITKQHKSDKAQPFELFSKKVLSAIEKTAQEKGRVFIFSARRGLAPVVTCVDCGYVFRSARSGAPYSLVRTVDKDKNEIRWFVDGVSGERVRAADSCAHCGSWRIRERGIGIQHVYDELSKKIARPIILFDHLTANTPKKARYLSDKFCNNPGTIMLGTVMALPYLGSTVSTSVIVNTDALRATPTWRSQEEMLATILYLRERTSGVVYAQTQHTASETTTSISGEKHEEADDILDVARLGATERFYTEEIAARKQFHYPPFVQFVLLTYKELAEKTTNFDQIIKEKFALWKPFLYNGVTHDATHTRHALIRLKPNEPSKEFNAILRSLPHEIIITHDPERIV